MGSSSWRRLVLGVVIVGLGVVAALVAVGAVGADEPAPNEADVGFLQDMIDHHQQANLLASLALHGGASTPARNVALDVISAQRYEIGLMEGWLIRWELERGAPGRQAMGWMDMPVVVSAMPGMAPADTLADLSSATGADLDVRFLELMLEHHRGGVHMAQAAVDLAADPHVKWLAGLMARNQRREIREIETLLAG